MDTLTKQAIEQETLSIKHEQHFIDVIDDGGRPDLSTASRKTLREKAVKSIRNGKRRIRELGNGKLRILKLTNVQYGIIWALVDHPTGLRLTIGSDKWVEYRPEQLDRLRDCLGALIVLGHKKQLISNLIKLFTQIDKA